MYHFDINVDGISESFADIMYTSIHNLPCWKDEDRDKMMMHIRDRLIWHSQRGLNVSNPTIAVEIKQPMFFCGDEPADYTPFIRDSLPIAEINLNSPMWKKSHNESDGSVLVYKLQYCGKTSPYLLIAQFLVDMYQGTRHKLVQQYWNNKRLADVYPMTHGLMVNYTWIESIIEVLDCSDFTKPITRELATIPIIKSPCQMLMKFTIEGTAEC